MKRFATALLFGLSLNLTMAAQQPQPTQSPAQQEMNKEGALLQAKVQLSYEKLRGLQEFQDYLNNMEKLQELQKQYAAAGVHPQEQPKQRAAEPDRPTPKASLIPQGPQRPANGKQEAPAQNPKK